MSDSHSKATLYWPWAICLLYFLTGVTALGYEVLWARMLSTLFGVSIFGVVITVSAFMAGLGTGSLIGGKIQHKIRSPLVFFAVVELIVALFAFNLPSLLSVLDSHVSSLTVDSNFTVWFLYQSLSTFVLMMLPAFVLGLGFPMILSALRATKIPVALIYGVNTLGGVLGALMPLFLLPIVGWTVSDRLFAILGMILAFCVLIVHVIASRKMHWKSDTQSFTSRIFIAPLFAYAGIGASAIMLQIAWTRLYGMLLLRTEYVMAVILATFLVGIGLGSLLAIKLRHKNSLIIFPLVISTCAILSLYALPWVSAWAESASYVSLLDSMSVQAFVIALCTLPATLAFGAWFPLLASQYKSDPRMTSYLYGSNSIGAALGGLSVGFIILPLMGSTFAIVIAVVLVLISSLVWIEQRWFRFTPIVFIIFFLPVMSFPEVNVLLPTSQAQSKDLSFYEDAISITQVVEEKTGQRLLLSDLQRMDASTDPTAVTVQKNQARLALLLHPKPEKVLFLGLGTGITASGSLPYPNLERTAVELSNGAVKAAKTYFSLSNQLVVDKLQVVQDDARRFLKATTQSYDVIVGDLFHPDMVGRSALLSLQQFERARMRLNEDGVFVQWLALNQFDLKTLKVVMQTFKTAFSNSVIFMDGFRLALVGFNGQFYGVDGIKQNMTLLDVSGKKAITGGEGIWSWVGRYWGKIPSLNVGIQDEWAPIIEFQLPKAKFNRQIDLSALLAFMMKNRPNQTVAAAELGITEGDMPQFEQVYMSNEMYMQSWMAYFAGNQQQSQKLLSMAYAANPDDQWIGFGLADAMYNSIGDGMRQGYSEKTILSKILNIRPDHLGALKRFLHFNQKAGNVSEVERLKEQMRALAPLDKELRTLSK